MPAPNVGQRVASNWEAVVGTKPEDNIHDDYWLFNQFSKGDGFLGLTGGDFIAVPLEYAINTTAGSYTDMDVVSTTRIDVFDRAEYQWKEEIVAVIMSDLETDRNAGEGTVFPLLPAKLENARSSMRRTINTQLYSDGSGNGGKDIGGLQLLISSTPTTGIVGAINRANFAFWRNQQTSGAKTTTAYDNLRAAMRSIYNLSSNGMADAHPTVIVTDRATFEGFQGLLLANERFTDKSEADGGFKNEIMKFMGAKISYDVACPVGNVYMFNPKFLKLAYKKGSWFKMLPTVRPSNQTVEVTLIRTMCNLISTNARRSGVVTAANT